MSADSSQRPERAPRGLILSTGEDVPNGQSLRARLVITEFPKEQMNWPKLTDAQADAAKGLYAEAMAACL